MGKLTQGETMQVTHNLLRMLVYGIGMKKIVLHLPNDFSKGRKISPKEVELNQAAQFLSLIHI